MPAVTTRFDMTKQDMRKGKKTGWPVSVLVNRIQCGGFVLPYQDAVSSR